VVCPLVFYINQILSFGMEQRRVASLLEVHTSLSYQGGQEKKGSVPGLRKC
jgi:hypothetical protein